MSSVKNLRRRREAVLRRRTAPEERRKKDEERDDEEDEGEAFDDDDDDEESRLSPRSGYAQQKQNAEQLILQLVTHLDKFHVEEMHAQFREKDEIVGMMDFVRIVKNILPSYILKPKHKRDQQKSASEMAGLSIIRDEAELVRNLVELFHEIDVNGDGDVEWEEFTRFIVEKARLFKEQNALERIPAYAHVPTPAEKLEKNPGGLNAPRHRNLIDKICKIPDQHLLAVSEQHSNVVQLYDARDGGWQTSLKTNAVPLALSYVEPQQSLLVACSDMTMSQWLLTPDHVNNTARFKEKARWPTPDTLMCLTWADAQRYAYSGSTAGTIHAWDLAEREMKMALHGHEDIIMEVLHIKYLDNIVSASLDTTVRVWDTYTEKQSTLLRGHAKGVNALAYNSEHRFLISAGFDHDAFVWSPFVSTLLYKLKGHRAALVGCHAVEGTHELVTADCHGVLKLWDLRNFQCMQTFTSAHEPGDLDDLKGFQAFTHCQLPPKDPNQDMMDYRVVAGTKKLFFFDQHRVRKEPVTDDLPLRLVLLNEVSLTLLVVSDRSVKIWDAILGTLKRAYLDLSPADITAVCLDDRRRKFFVGNSAGAITCHNYQNGACMKKFPPFPGNARVVTVAYVFALKGLVAAAATGTIRVYDEKELEVCAVLRQFDEAYTHRAELSLMAHHEAGAIAATAAGASIEGIRIWDSDTAKCDSVLKTRGYVVLALGFLEPYPLLYVCSSDGMIRIWGVQPGSKIAGVCLVGIPNKPPKGSYYEFFDEDAGDDENGDGAARSAPPHSSRPRLLPPWAPRNPKRTHTEPSGDAGLPEGVAAGATPVSAAGFDATRNHLYVGDELGNLRCFDLSLCLALLELGVPDASYAIARSPCAPAIAPLRADADGRELAPEVPDVDVEAALEAALGEDWRGRLGAAPEAEPGAAVAVDRALHEHHLLKPHELRAYEAQNASTSDSWTIDDILKSPRLDPDDAVRPLLPEALCRLVWAVEYAHEEAILSVGCCGDPSAVVTAGLDRCVRMWDGAGSFRGVLLQGLAPGSTNPCWSLDLDVAARENKDKARTTTVVDALEEFERAARATEKRGSLKMKRRESQLSYRLEKAKELAVSMQDAAEGRTGGNSVSTDTLNTSSTTKLSPPTDARMHSRVRSALSDVKSMHTAEPPVSDGLLSESSSWQSSQQGREPRRRSSLQGRRASRSGLKAGSLDALSPKPSVMTSASTADLFHGSTLSNATPAPGSRKHGGSINNERGTPATPLGKQILDHKSDKKPRSNFLSVVPPLPDLQRLGPEAQKSLDNLTLALHMA
ncbi:hypothetical protein SO694_00013011 [Aureococcus anophagefferens]|uniref:EF-hand domain-containing protein n=2 Tax=Aureococcus anophagefferens TaxID=44056 RepID=A0ABR1G0V2_AURAN